MKKFLLLGAAALGLLAVVQSASGQQTVGLCISAYGGAPSNSTPSGYSTYAQTNWNSTGALFGSGTSTVTASGLLDSTGAATGISYTLSGQNQFSNGSPAFSYITYGNNDNFWLDGNADVATGSNSPVTLTLSGLTVGADYTLVAYVGAWQYQSAGNASVSAGGATYYYTYNSLYGTPSGGESNLGWVQITSTTSESPTTGDVAVFTNLTPAGDGTLTLTVSEGTDSPALGASLGAVQLIEQSVPEPSTYAMMLGGLGMLLAGKRIRRR